MSDARIHDDDTRSIRSLTREMDEAVAALDFERARLLRDQINLLRGGATLAEALAADTSGIQRQQPGAMGIGSNRQRVTPPDGWGPPVKPDPMTRATGRGPKRPGRSNP